MSRLRLAGGIALAIVSAAVAIAVVDPFGGSQDGVADRPDSTSLASVKRGPLSAQVYQNGTLGYAARPDGSPHAVVNQASGTYTALPVTGEVIGCGQVLYRVAAEPVVLLCGRTTAYRSLSEGMSGPDVRQLNRNLVDLGYATRAQLDPSSDELGAATTAALLRLQADVGIDQTGVLELGDALFLPGPLRITKVIATPGTMARPGAPLAQASSTRRRVEVDLDASQAATVEVGDRAQVTLPDNRTTPGVVTRIGSVASSAGEPGSDASGATIPVSIRLNRAKDAGRLDEAPVQVQITTDGVEDALSVPVTALLARSGGYAVETVDGAGERELVPVRLGMFDHANGLVQVTGSGLSAGQKVVVPAT